MEPVRSEPGSLLLLRGDALSAFLEGTAGVERLHLRGDNPLPPPTHTLTSSSAPHSFGRGPLPFEARPLEFPCFYCLFLGYTFPVSVISIYLF